MKKIYLSIVLLASLVLVACSSSDNDDSIHLEGHEFVGRSYDLAVTLDGKPDRLLSVASNAEVNWLRRLRSDAGLKSWTVDHNGFSYHLTIRVCHQHIAHLSLQR